MKPLAVFYHVRLEGGTPPIDPDAAMPIMAEQMRAAADSGLLEVCQEFHVASNGGPVNMIYAAMLAPSKAILHDNGAQAESHLPTVNLLRAWLPSHADWYVCYFHIKGVTHPGDALNTNWRRCMDRAVISNWRKCVADLDDGYDSAGAHWLTPEKYGSIVKTPFWGGMFFWAKASFLLTLPALKQVPTCREDWFLSEGWIGMGPRRPRVHDYCPHWPSLAACSK